MSQIFLYGSPFKELPPPQEWKSNGIDSVVNDNVVTATPTTNIFTFVGPTATAILEWKANFGVYNGMPFKEVFFDGTLTNTVFNGYIKLDELEYNSTQNPALLRCPIVKLDDPKTIMDDFSVMTQGVLRKQGYLIPSDFVDVPVIIRSRISRKEKELIIRRFTGASIVAARQFISGLLSGISDVIGASYFLGIAELVSVLSAGYSSLLQLIEEGKAIKDLFLPAEVYYKAASIKTFITKAAASKGYTVDFGTLDDLVSKSYILASQYENNGAANIGLPDFGILQRADFGYVISEILEGLDIIANIRTATIGNVIHIRPRVDPFWTQVPSYTPENILIKTVSQYSNGVYRDDTSSLKASVIVNYQYDQTDQWTLTEKSGDSHEVRRRLISESNPRMNTFKGLDPLDIPWAMCVRDNGSDEIIDLSNSAFDVLNDLIDKAKFVINQYYDQIAVAGSEVQGYIDGILGLPFISGSLPNPGALKISDNCFAIPKLVYLEDVNIDGNTVKRIPENFKDFIGAKALYDNWRKPESPADINNFKGQYRLINALNIKFSQKDWTQTTTNPFFILNNKNSYFMFTNWIEDKHKASAEIRVQEVFDTNITEEEI